MNKDSLSTLDDSRSSPAMRGKRVRAIRDQLRFSRADIQERYLVKANTLQAWEDARFGGLSEKGAKKLVKAFHAEGISCTLEWLLHGVGKDPLTPSLTTKSFTAEPKTLFIPTIAQELRHFHQSHPGIVDAIVSDDSMEPCFLPGDHVAGKRYFEADVDKALNTSCIIQLTTGITLIRVLKAGSKKGCYTLTSVNPDTTVASPTLTDVTVFSAAPIIWFRRTT